MFWKNQDEMKIMQLYMDWLEKIVWRRQIHISEMVNFGLLHILGNSG